LLRGDAGSLEGFKCLEKLKLLILEALRIAELRAWERRAESILSIFSKEMKRGSRSLRLSSLHARSSSGQLDSSTGTDAFLLFLRSSVMFTKEQCGLALVEVIKAVFLNFRLPLFFALNSHPSSDQPKIAQYS